MMSGASDGHDGSLSDAITELTDATDSFSEDLAAITSAIEDSEISAKQWRVSRK